MNRFLATDVLLEKRTKTRHPNPVIRTDTPPSPKFLRNNFSYSKQIYKII